MYSVDKNLVMPFNTSLFGLMSDYKFKRIVGNDIVSALHIIRKAGNEATHTNAKLTQDNALLILENMFYFMDWIVQYYIGNHDYRRFSKNVALAPKKVDEEKIIYERDTKEADELKKKLAELQSQLDKATAENQILLKKNNDLVSSINVNTEKNQSSYVKPGVDLLSGSEWETRKFIIDLELREAGWVEGKDWKNEVPVTGMKNQTGNGFVDYVLYGNDGKPLALIEAKRTSVSVETGRKQASEYADLLEKQYGSRPVIFLANGKEIRIIDSLYPERQVSGFFTKTDLLVLKENYAKRKSGFKLL